MISYIIPKVDRLEVMRTYDKRNYEENERGGKYEEKKSHDSNELIYLRIIVSKLQKSSMWFMLQKKIFGASKTSLVG